MISSPIRRAACAVLVSHLLLSSSALRADDRAPGESPAATVAPTPTATPAPRRTRKPDSAITSNNRNPKRHAEFLARKAQGPIDLLFLGDSITDSWPGRGADTWAKFAPYQPADFAVSGERTEDVLWRITNGELDGLHPKVVVLMLGTNNVGQHWDEEPAWVVAGMLKIVDVIHERLPDAKLLLLGIFPRDGKNSSNRQRNEAVNAELAKFADGDKTRYLDIGKVFLDANGEIPNDVMPDKLHPNAKGYNLWYDAMSPTLVEMMK